MHIVKVGNRKCEIVRLPERLGNRKVSDEVFIGLFGYAFMSVLRPFHFPTHVGAGASPGYEYGI